MGMLGWSSKAVCVACIVMLFGRLTITPCAHGVLLVQCALVPRKWLVQPESAIALLLSNGRLIMFLFIVDTIVFACN